MSSVGPPAADDNDKEAPPITGEGADDDSVVSPPSYPAYSTPPPEGLHTAEDG